MAELIHVPFEKLRDVSMRSVGLQFSSSELLTNLPWKDFVVDWGPCCSFTNHTHF
jgi:hypothetical protein